MSEEITAEPPGRALGNRPNASRKLLARKARASTPVDQCGDTLEERFPGAAAGSSELASPRRGSSRKRSVPAQQKLRVGGIQPNPSTVPAVIVQLVAARSEVSRAELLAAMHDSGFPHPAARPRDRSWCQGYVAGAIRNGFLAVVPEPPTCGSAERV